jgi:hypothetical protein
MMIVQGPNTFSGSVLGVMINASASAQIARIALSGGAPEVS